MKRICIAIGLLICLCFCGCSAGIYELSQTPDEIVKIELYSNSSEPGTYTRQENITFIRQLDEDEIALFVQEISALEMIMANPPSYGFGCHIAAITYSNGDVDIISDRVIEYVPAGKQPGQVSGHTFSGDAFENIFQKYADLQPS